MTDTAILIAVVAVPLVLFTILRVNAALVFLSLCLGNLLVQFVGPDTDSLLSLFSVHGADSGSVKLALLLFPAALTTIGMIRTVRGKTKLLLNLLPAAGAGFIGLLLAMPLLSPELSAGFRQSGLWRQTDQAKDLIVSVSALSSLLVLWLQRPKPAAHEKHGGKHHH